MAGRGGQPSRWQRFLEGRTTWQRFIVAIGGLAGALIAIGGLIEAGSFSPDHIEGGVWYRGCLSVVREGAGYGAEHLDLEFTKERRSLPLLA
ncbi:MAG: hypothetical protein ACRD2W_05335 [Acidimicrobiales bacterium]